MEKRLRSITKKIHALFKQHGYTLSIAESCTGGLVSHLITAQPGASHFFEAAVVSYSADAKKTLLRVSPDCIAQYGVVSEQTAREMAKKIRQLANTDYSLATTGNLGPDVLEGKKRGLIFIGVSTKNETAVTELSLKGSRSQINQEAACLALHILLEFIQKQSIRAKKLSR